PCRRGPAADRRAAAPARAGVRGRPRSHPPGDPAEMRRAGDAAPPSEDRAHLKRLVDTLERLPPEGLNRHWRGRRYARPEVLEALLARGEEHLRTEPRRSERLGLLGIFLAGRIEGSEAWVAPGVVRAGLLVGA